MFTWTLGPLKHVITDEQVVGIVQAKWSQRSYMGTPEGSDTY